MPETDPPRGLRKIRLVSFDIDGTIAVGHGWRAIARARWLEEEFDEAQELFTQGRTTEDQHLRRLLNFARGMTVREVFRVLEHTRHLPHLAETVQALHARGVQVALLTHNPAYICQWYAEHFGFDLWAGVLQRVSKGRVEAVHRLHVDKRAGLGLLLLRTGVAPFEAAHLGDGLADARVFPHVATGVALNSRVPEVRRASDLTADTLDARSLLPLLRFGFRAHPRRLPRLPPGSFRVGAPAQIAHKS